jgi:hypothetical protein
VYYYFAVMRSGYAEATTPRRGADDPFVFFVDDRHLEDLDRHGDLLDGFDVARTINDDGSSEVVVNALLQNLLSGPPAQFRLTRGSTASALQFPDGSTFAVPRPWSGRITDVTVTPGVAARLLHEHRTSRIWPGEQPPIDICRSLERVAVNDVFYRREPHMQRRYAALAWDNVRRDPLAYLGASAYRAIRLFVVQGTTDASTAWQFSGSAVVYTLATLASIAYLVLAAAGVAIAVKRRARVWLLLTPIVYIPATICFVLTNMRYTITVQPLLLAFGAVALTAAARDAAPSGRRTTSLPS